MARTGARRPGAGLLQLSEKYPAYPVARLFGDAAKPLPVWAEVALAEQWQDVEAPLGYLDLSKPVPDADPALLGAVRPPRRGGVQAPSG